MGISSIFAAAPAFHPAGKSRATRATHYGELAEVRAKEREMRQDRAGYIFSARNVDKGSGHLARMDRPFRDAVIRAGLDPAVITPHVVRHTAITKLVQAGVDLPTIQRISGHKTVATVLRYSHVSGPHIDAAIGALECGACAITPKLHQGSRRPVGSIPANR